MAQVVLDVVYNVKGMQALKQSQAAMNQAANAANGGANNIRRYNQALTANGTAATKSATANAAASKGFRATGFAATSASGGVKSFGIALSAALGPIAAITGGLALVSKTIGIFSDRQKDVAVLQNGLQNLGQEGTSALDTLQASADKLGKTTLFDEEQFTRGYALLTSFQRIGVGSYERVAQAAADLAQTTGQDLNGALLQLSKALEDPARRVTDLARSGTVFTEQQKEQIKVLQQSGNMLGAQNLILKEIERQYGGAAEAAGSAGFAGAMDSAGEAARDLGEAVGEIIVPALENFLRTITPIIESLAKFVGYASKIPGVLSGIQGATGGLASMFDKPKKDAKELKTTLEDLPDPISEAERGLAAMRSGLAAAKSEAKRLEAAQANGNTLAQARLTAESQLLQVKRQQAEAELASAQTEQEKIAAIDAIYEATVAQAKVEYQQTKLNLDVSIKKLEVQRDYLQLKVKEAQIEYNLAKQRNEDVTAAQQAVVLAMEGLGIANQQIAAQKQANAILLESAAALRDQKIEAAGVLRQQQLQEAQQQATNNAISQGANEMGRLANEAQRAASAAAGVAAAGAAGGGGKKAPGSKFTVWHGDQTYDKYKLDENGNVVETTEEERRRQKNSAAINRMNAIANKEQVDNFLKTFDWKRHWEKGWQAPKVGPGNTSISSRTAFAEGGYVTGPTDALIGEGGEPEYVIPESKMSRAMSRYGSGARGNSVLSGSVNVNYSGTTLNFNGDEYVQKKDVGGIIKSATNATQSRLANSAAYRLNAGMS